MYKRKTKLTEEELQIISPLEHLDENELFEKFVNAKRLEGVSESTIKLYYQIKRVMTRDIEISGIKKPMSTLTKNDLEKLILYWKTDVRVATVNNRLRVIKVYYKTLRRLKLIKMDPMEGFSQLREKEQIKPTLTHEEIKKIIFYYKKDLSYSKYRDLVVFQLLLDTGMRIGELVNLQVSDISTESITIAETKSKRQRVIYPSQKCLKAIEAYLKIRSDFDSPILFLSFEGKPITIRQYQHNLATAGKRAGVKKNVSPHMLRRTYAKFAIMEGIDPFSLARLLGHEDLQTTTRYVQIWGAELQEQSKKRGKFDKYF